MEGAYNTSVAMAASRGREKSLQAQARRGEANIQDEGLTDNGGASHAAIAVTDGSIQQILQTVTVHEVETRVQGHVG